VLDADANARNGPEISSSDSRLRAFCIPTDEELLIARDTVNCIFKVPRP
jgi:acetate kinase